MYDSGAGSGGGSSRYYWRDGIKYSAMNDPELGHIMSDGLGNWIPDTRWQTLPIRALNNAGNFLGDAMVGGQEAVQGAGEALDYIAGGVLGGGRKVRDFTYDKFMRPIMDNPTYEKYWEDPLVSFFENKSNSVPTEGPMRFAGRGVPAPVTSGGPLSRGEPWKRHIGRIDENWRPGGRLEQELQAQKDMFGRVETVVDDYIPSHEVPGYDRMVNEGYDSWSPSDAIEDFGVSLPYMTGVAAKDVDTRTDWQKWKDSFKRDW